VFSYSNKTKNTKEKPVSAIPTFPARYLTPESFMFILNDWYRSHEPSYALTVVL
jgi:hypothetical protein